MNIPDHHILDSAMEGDLQSEEHAGMKWSQSKGPSKAGTENSGQDAS